jgi:hypothetical protein
MHHVEVVHKLRAEAARTKAKAGMVIQRDMQKPEARVAATIVAHPTNKK